MIRCVLLTFLVVGSVLVLAGEGHAQVTGVAVSLPDATGMREPVVGVTVELLGANLVVLDTTQTKKDGSFSFPTVPPGAGNSFSIRFSGLDDRNQLRADTRVGSLNPQASQNLSVVVPIAQTVAPIPQLAVPYGSSHHRKFIYRFFHH
jgi:hypothetical protein